MANFTIPEVGKVYLLNYKLGFSGASLAGAKMHLADPGSTFTFAPRDQLLGDFVECTFPGYAPVVVGPWSPVIDDAVNFWAKSNSQVCIFTNTSATLSFNVAGWYLTDAGGMNLIAFEQFTPVVSLGPGQSLTVQLELRELSLYNN